MPRGRYDHKRQRLLTSEQEAWLLEHYPTHSNAELSRILAERFGATVTATQLGSWAKRHDVRKERATVVHAHKAGARYLWREEELDFMREFVPGHVYPQFADEFERRFGWRPTRNQYKNACVRYGIRSGVRDYGRFKKGTVPPNKGKKWDDFLSPEAQRRIRESSTMFEKGHRPHNGYHRLLDMRQDTRDGSWMIYVKPRDAKTSANHWMSHARFVWMQHHGREFPKGHRCVHCNHDNMDDRPENLVAVPEDVYCIVTSGKHGLEYWDRESFELALLHAKMMTTAKRKMIDMPRRCAVCGRMFVVDEKRRKYGDRVQTCPECRSQGKRASGRRKRNADKGKQRGNGIEIATVDEWNEDGELIGQA